MNPRHLLACAVLAGILFAHSAAAVAETKVKAGDPAPKFSLTGLDGKTYDVGAMIGKQTILFDFWSIYCDPCKKEIPHIQKIYDKYKDRGLAVFSINNDPFPPAKISGTVTKELSMVTYPFLLDKERVATNGYGVFVLPVTVLISPQGKVAFYHTGFQKGDEGKIEEEILKVLPKAK